MSFPDYSCSDQNNPSTLALGVSKKLVTSSSKEVKKMENIVVNLCQSKSNSSYRISSYLVSIRDGAPLFVNPLFSNSLFDNKRQLQEGADSKVIVDVVGAIADEDDLGSIDDLIEVLKSWM